MKTRMANLKEDRNSTNLNKLINEEEFLSFSEQILKTSNIMSSISSFRESTIEQRLQAERLMFPDVFALGHPNYGLYLTYQDVMLSNLHLENPGAWEELVKEGLSRILSGQPFSTEYGDLIIGTTINREVKVRGGPMQGGYSTNLSAMNKFVKNIHLLPKLRAAMKNKLRVLTSSKHKETTLFGKHLHELTIVSMVQQLERYLNPFDE